MDTVDKYLEYLDGDRIVYTFVLVWVVAGAVWLMLDWLTNPNRGGFKPKRDRRVRGWRARRDARRRRFAEADAEVRTTLRDAYGASSLRTLWNRRREARVLEVDNLLVRRRPELPGRRSRLPIRARLGELLPGETESAREPLLATFDEHRPPEPPEPLLSSGRWRSGMHPLTRSPDGIPPSPETMGRRVWKNHADDPMWGSENRARMSEGLPPVRLDPITGKKQTASVDPVSTRPCWPDAAVDPFAGQS